MLRLALALCLLAGNGWAALPVTDGLVLHLDSTVGITKDGSNKVSAWADQSGEGNDCWNAAATTAQPTWVDAQYDGRPWLAFDGGDYLTSTASVAAGTGAKSVFVLFQTWAVAVDNQIPFTLGPNALSACGAMGFGYNVIWGWTGACDKSYAAFGSVGATGARVLAVTWNGSGGTISRWNNLDNLDTGTAGAAWNTLAGYVVGGLKFDQFLYPRAIMEIAVYDRVVTSAERIEITNYMLCHSCTGALNNRSPYIDLFLYPEQGFLRRLLAPFVALTMPRKAEAHVNDQRALQAQDVKRYLDWEVKTNRITRTRTLTPKATETPRIGTPTRTATATPTPDPSKITPTRTPSRAELEARER